MAAIAEVTVLDYNDLVTGADLGADIERAYGETGLGILTVKNVPGLEAARRQLLVLAQRFATLSDEVKDKYKHPESKYSFGWSHGIENLEGKPDSAKGSYYANPQYDRPVDDEALIAEFPAFLHPNIWPTEDLPELEGAFKELGRLIVKVGSLITIQCDRYIKSRCPSYEDRRLERVVSTSKVCKARLLHYFARDEATSAAEAEAEDCVSSWCGWHNDHGTLTGLVSALYMDAAGQVVENTDSRAGLYARSRSSALAKINIPENHIAFQIGETAQIHSGGLLQATPHAVRGSNVPGVSRETFAVFMEPNWNEPMDIPAGRTPSEAQSQAAAANLPPGVPPLSTRWNPDQLFSDFTDSTLAMYY